MKLYVVAIPHNEVEVADIRTFNNFKSAKEFVNSRHNLNLWVEEVDLDNYVTEEFVNILRES